jgi:hypothetical protein
VFHALEKTRPQFRFLWQNNFRKAAMSLVLAHAEALWDFQGNDAEDLPFNAGDILAIVDQTDDDWWQV